MKIFRFHQARMAIACAALLLGGCFDDSAETLVEKAKASMEKQDSKAAAILLKSALQKDAQNATARFMLGKLLLEAGDLRGSTIEFQKAADLGYDRDQVVPALAYVMYSRGDSAKALSSFGSVTLGSKGAEASLKSTLAAAQLTLGKSQEALVLVDAALAANPRFTQALLLKAKILGAQRKLDDAFGVVAIAVDTDPKSGEPHKVRGDLWMGKGPDLVAAESSYREAIKVEPGNVSAHAALIWLALNRSDLAAAQAEVDALNKVAPRHPNTRYLNARIAYEKGDMKLAREVMQQVLRQAPDAVRNLLLAGAIEVRLGNLVQAEAALGKANALEPENTRVRLSLGQAQLRMGEAAKATKTLQPLLAKGESDADAIAALAEAQLQLGEPAKAEALYAKAAALNPKDTRSKTMAAVAMMERGQVDKGMEELRLVSISDSQPTADLALISAHLRRKDLAQAQAAAERLQRKQPKSAMVASLRGEIEMRLGNRESARAALEAAEALDPGYLPAQMHLTNLEVADGQLDKATQRLKKLVQANPSDARAQLALFTVRRQAGAAAPELIDAIDTAVRANPTSPELRLALIQEYANKPDPKLAHETAQKAVAALPASLELLAALGRTQALIGDSNQAMATFGKLALAAPKSPQPLLEMAEFQLSRRDRAGAAQSLKKALSIAPGNAQAQTRLIAVEMESGRAPEALAIAKTMQTQRAESSLGFLFEGDIQTQQGNWAGAAKSYQLGIARQPTTELSVKLHSALLKAGKVDEADRHSKDWLLKNPKDVVYLVHHGDTLVQRNDLAGGQQYYERALALQKDLPAALNNLAWVLNRQKKPGALEAINRAILLAPKEATFLDTKAEIYMGQGDLPKAIEAQRAALALAPEAHPMRLRLARYLIAAGQGPAAKQELDALEKLGNAFAQQAQVKELRAKL